MWLKDVIAELITPKSVKELSSEKSNTIVIQNLKHSLGRLSASSRSIVWAELGVPDLTASYLRRSIMRPSTKRAIAYESLVNKIEFVWGEGNVEEVVRATIQLGSLQIQGRRPNFNIFSKQSPF